jgi:hypothetical protein
MSNELIPFDDIMKLGEVLAKSGFFQDSRQAAQAVVKVLAGRELGFGPITSMMSVHIVQGRVTLSANLIAASIRKSGKYNYKVVEHTDKRCHLDFYQGEVKLGKSVFTIEDAKKAELVKPKSNWIKWPKNMLFARSLSNGAKWFCPDVFTTGVYTPDELGAVVDGETGEVIEAPRVEVIDDPEPEPKASANGNVDPARPYSPGEIRTKIRAYAEACKEVGKFHDAETGEAVPIKMHPYGDRTPQLLAAKMQEALGGEEAYHAVLDYFFFGVDSANELRAVEADAMFRILFNGSKEIGFKLPVLDVAKAELAKVYEVVMDGD